jgi:trehalose-6-phosphate synthase
MDVKQERRELVERLKKGRLIGFGNLKEFVSEWEKIKKILMIAGELNRGSGVAEKILKLEELVESVKLTELDLALTQIIQLLIEEGYFEIDDK